MSQVDKILIEEKANEQKIAFLGPEGTFTEEALNIFLTNKDLITVPYQSIDEVLNAVDKGEVGKGFVPIENSIEGSVNLTLDMLIHEVNLKISNEIIIPIRHNLIVNKGTKIEEIRRVFSHPQAIAQCRKFLRTITPKAKIVYTASTAEAIEKISHHADERVGAIGTTQGAEAYGLEVKLPQIQDYQCNQTRFILVEKNCLKPRQSINNKYKTSLVFSLPDQAGTLYEVLKVFAEHSINMKKIESRPAKKFLGEYVFFIDIVGHEKDEKISKTLKIITKKTNMLKLLGSYEVIGGEG